MMRGWDYGYGGMMNGWGWGGWLAMLFFGLLVLIGLILLVVWAVRTASGGNTHAGPQQPNMPTRSDGHDEAVALAKRRLASGEITPDEYGEIMTRLGD
jgi:uncharacterized membrane protein